MSTTPTPQPTIGRPPDRGVRKITTSMRLTPIVLQYLAEHESTAANVVEDCVRRSADFRRWLAAQDR